jgi:hypothetical protein
MLEGPQRPPGLLNRHRHPGGVLAAAASAWSERDQARINEFLHHMLEMLNAEMREKEQTILAISARIDMQDEKISAARGRLHWHAGQS